MTEDQLIEYTDTMVYGNGINMSYIYQSIFQLQVFDSNKDGKLQLSEMAKYIY